MKPTVGRIVHFRPLDDKTDRYAAIVTRVHDSGRVDLCVFERFGSCYKYDIGQGPNGYEWDWPPREIPPAIIPSSVSA